MVIFGAIPGEAGKFRIVNRGRNQTYAQWVYSQRPSPHRVKPPCERYESCGGCPLMHLDAAGQERAKTMLGRMNPDGLVFDIIYDPDRTILLQHAEELGIATINGAGMNLEQAVIAFGYALGDQADMARTRTGMDAARRS